jgi:hypothetical protein
MNIVCLTASTNVSADVGLDGMIITSTVIGGENSTVNDTIPGDVPPDSPLSRRQSSETSDYCLVQSYDWVGSDVIRPDCDNSANANLAQCIDPTNVTAENGRIANLYPNSLLCSKCFLKMFYLRLASPYLPDVDHSDYLVEQWFDMLDVCEANSSMPELVVRSRPFYDSAPGFSNDGASNTTEEIQDPLPLAANQTYNGTCTDRIITFADLKTPSLDSTQGPCDVIPSFLKMSTGDTQKVMGNLGCAPDFNVTEIPSVCAPQPCEVVELRGGTTW